MEPHVLILAAGASTRMRGADKLLLPVSGVPMVAQVARVALSTGLPVSVILPADQPQRRAALADLPVRCQVLADRNDGIGASLAAAVAMLPKQAPVLILLADMPALTPDDLDTVLAVWNATPDCIIRATDADGTPGHPVGFPVWLLPELKRLSGDQGAQQIISAFPERLRRVELPGHRATTDIDTPEDWQKWQGREQ